MHSRFKFKGEDFEQYFLELMDGRRKEWYDPDSDRYSVRRVALLPHGDTVPDLDVRQAGDPEPCARLPGGQHRQPLLRRHRQDAGRRGVCADPQRKGAQGRDPVARLPQQEAFVPLPAHAAFPFAEDRVAAEGRFGRAQPPARIRLRRRRAVYAGFESAQGCGAGRQGPGQIRSLRGRTVSERRHYPRRRLPVPDAQAAYQHRSGRFDRSVRQRQHAAARHPARADQEHPARRLHLSDQVGRKP